VNVVVITEPRYWRQAQPGGLVAELARRGCRVRVVDPGDEAIEVTRCEWAESADVCIARGRSQGVLSLLAAAEAVGAIALNSSRSTAAVRDKVGMAASLAAAGISTPSTYVGSATALAALIPASRYPLIAKPILGDNSRGLRLIEDPRNLFDSSTDREEALLAQPYVSGPADDLKLYGIGDQVWAVRKRSPFATKRKGARREVTAQQVPLTPPLEELALSCRHIFGLELFGVDCLETEAGPLVIEVNEFPNYTAVPEADERLADYVVAKTAKALAR